MTIFDWRSPIRSADPSARRFVSLPLALLLVALFSAFTIGGGARSDIVSLLLLRPIAAIVAIVALWRVSGRDVANHRAIVVIMLSSIALLAMHLVPLPAEVWQSLPDRGLVVALERLAGLENHWRPFTLTPAEGWNALLAMLIPLAVLLAGMQTRRGDLAKVVTWLIGLGLLSAVIGLLQMLGGPGSPIYFYRHTNWGAPVGLFANANHQAVFLAALVPALAVAGRQRGRKGQDVRSQTDWRRWLALFIGALFITIIVLTGSRAGVLALALGLMSIAWLRPSVGAATTSASRWAIVAAGGAAIAALAVALRGEALLGAFSSSGSAAGRTEFWPQVWAMAQRHLPLGAGSGSFADVYQIHESAADLSPNYLNHAHNDWLEVLATLGVPGAALALAGLGWTLTRGWRLHRMAAATATSPAGDGFESVTLGRLGVVIILIFAVASVFDYPLRTPSLSALLVVAALFAQTPFRATSAPPRLG